jgi:hypothetical protein
MPSSGRLSISTQAWASRSLAVSGHAEAQSRVLITQEMADDERPAQARSGGEGPDVGARVQRTWRRRRQRRQRQLPAGASTARG